MKYIQSVPGPDGSFPPLMDSPAQGFLSFPEEFVPIFYPDGKEASGFVHIQSDGETVTDCQWNEDAYQAYLDALPEQTGETPPTEAEQLRADLDYLAAMTGVIL